MGAIILTPILVFCIFGSASGGYMHPVYPRDVGLPCLYDEDCPMLNSFCKNHVQCDCKRDYTLDQHSGMCYPEVLGLKCEETHDCYNLKNALCVESICGCGRDFVPASDGKSCLPLSRLSGSCLEVSQCINHTPHSHCNVTSGECECDPGFHNAEGPPQCIQDTALGAVCTANRDCYVDEDHVDFLECVLDEATALKRCRCGQGLNQQGSRCTRGGSAQAVISIAVLLFITIINITS